MIPKRRVVLKRNWCVASGGKQLSIQAFLPRLVASAPILTGVCLLAAFSMSIALQGAELLRVVRTPATLPTNSTIPTIAPISEASTSQLFGVHQLADNDPPPATNLQLTLLGSFVHRDSQRSSALIQRQGHPEQRYTIGDEVDNGARLNAVHTNHVELLRNGRRESLAFPGQKTSPHHAHVALVEQSKSPLQQLSQLKQSDMQSLQERMQALREQIENTGAQSPITAPD